MDGWFSDIWQWWVATLLGGLSGFVLSWHRERWERNRRRAVAVLVALTSFLAGAPLALTWLERWREDRDGPVRLHVVLKTRVDTEGWNFVSWARPGDTVEFLMEVENVGPATATDLAVGFNAAPNQEWVPHSLKVATGRNPAGLEMFDSGAESGGQHLLFGGLDLGHFRPGANVFLTWQMRIDPSWSKSGTYALSNIGVARAVGNRGNEYYSRAVVNVDV